MVSSLWLALPLALVSHFALDSLPHFGFKKLDERGERFTALLLIDASLCGLLVLGLFLSGTQLWVLASLAALAAASPDFMWAPDYFRHKLHGTAENHRSNMVKRFHAKIQWYQKPLGALFEALYFVGMLFTLVKLV